VNRKLIISSSCVLLFIMKNVPLGARSEMIISSEKGKDSRLGSLSFFSFFFRVKFHHSNFSPFDFSLVDRFDTNNNFNNNFNNNKKKKTKTKTKTKEIDNKHTEYS